MEIVKVIARSAMTFNIARSIFISLVYVYIAFLLLPFNVRIPLFFKSCVMLKLKVKTQS